MQRKLMNRKKSQIWVSAVLYMLIGSIVIILILEAGLPIVKKNRDKSVFTKTRDMFMGLDNVITDVIDEGVGSQRVVEFEISDGKVTLKNDVLRWEMESDTKILEPRTMISLGNLKIVSDIDVNSYDMHGAYVLENSHIRVNISKTGSSTHYAVINTSQIITSFYSIDTGTELGGIFSFALDNNPATALGMGYTELLPEGNNTNIDSARVRVKSRFHKSGCHRNPKIRLTQLKNWACAGFSRWISRTQKKQKAKMP